MPNNAIIIAQFKAALGEILSLPPEAIFLFWKGRVALYALLKAMGIGAGDEVILPAYTCVVVPNAILYTGAKPVYVDIEATRFNMAIDQVEAAITPKTKVIICQNTYGLSSHLEALQTIATRHGLLTIEDCTHGFGGHYAGQPNGTFCDAAFFSTQWNKPFSTGLGGFATAKSAVLQQALADWERQAEPPPLKSVLLLQILYFVRQYLLTPGTYWPLVKLYRLLSRYNLILGSSSGDELSTITMPAGYVRQMSATQARAGLKALPKLPAQLQQRQATAAIYTQWLVERHKQHVPPAYFKDHSFLKYPLLVRDRADFLNQAEQAKVELGDWFISPLHPIHGDLSPWQFERQRFPIAHYQATHVVNLPTTPASVTTVLAFLATQEDAIL